MKKVTKFWNDKDSSKLTEISSYTLQQCQTMPNMISMIIHVSSDSKLNNTNQPRIEQNTVFHELTKKHKQPLLAV